jgi:hypothetical protein
MTKAKLLLALLAALPSLVANTSLQLQTDDCGTNVTTDTSELTLKINLHHPA